MTMPDATPPNTPIGRPTNHELRPELHRSVSRLGVLTEELGHAVMRDDLDAALSALGALRVRVAYAQSLAIEYAVLCQLAGK